MADLRTIFTARCDALLHSHHPAHQQGDKEVGDGLREEKCVSHVNLEPRVHTSQVLGLECSALCCYRGALLATDTNCRPVLHDEKPSDTFETQHNRMEHTEEEDKDKHRFRRAASRGGWGRA